MIFPRHEWFWIRLAVSTGLFFLLAGFLFLDPGLAEGKPAGDPPPPVLSPSPESSRPATHLAVTVTVTPLGSAAKERPLPVGATPSLRVSVRNTGTSALKGLILKVRADEMKAESQPGWRLEGGALIAEIARIGAGEQVERMLKLRIDSAPESSRTNHIAVELRSENGAIVLERTSLRVADCVGAYRSRLAGLRSEMIQNVKDAAEAMRKPDLALPHSRSFPATGARSGNIAGAERLAAAIASHGGADPEMGQEGMRFIIQRWMSELSAYAGQESNRGLCAANYYMIAGQREGLLQLRRRLEMVQIAASHALAAARSAVKAEPDDDLAKIIGLAIRAAGLEAKEDNASALTALAKARASLNKDQKLEPERGEALSLSETAAWLAEIDKRARVLASAIESTFSTIATAHRESCVCAF